MLSPLLLSKVGMDGRRCIPELYLQLLVTGRPSKNTAVLCPLRRLFRCTQKAQAPTSLYLPSPIQCHVRALTSRCWDCRRTQGSYNRHLKSLPIGISERSRLELIVAARENEPPLDSGGPGCPVSAVGGPGSVRTDAAADGVATVGNDAVLSCYGPTESRVGSLVSGDSATPCRGRANGGQALASGEAEATVGASAVVKAKPLMEEMARSVPLAPPHAGGLVSAASRRVQLQPWLPKTRLGAPISDVQTI